MIIQRMLQRLNFVTTKVGTRLAEACRNTYIHAQEKALADQVRQLVFGLGHGLLSILGLSIGVASATGSPRTVAVTGVVGMLTGLATLVALQYLSAKTQKEVYDHMVEEERREFAEHPEIEKAEMRKYYIEEGFSPEEADSFVNRLSLDRNRWLKPHITQSWSSSLERT